MRILATQYTLSNKSLEIYVAGCNGNPHCINCHNPESWSFEQGVYYNDDYQEKINVKIKDFDTLIDNIMIFGGEPLDQDLKDLNILLLNLSKLNKKVWLFTRYELNEVPDSIKALCDYIKCGRYIEELKTENNIAHGIKLATSNQSIFQKGKDY